MQRALQWNIVTVSDKLCVLKWFLLDPIENCTIDQIKHTFSDFVTSTSPSPSHALLCCIYTALPGREGHHSTTKLAGPKFFGPFSVDWWPFRPLQKEREREKSVALPRWRYFCRVRHRRRRIPPFDAGSILTNVGIGIDRESIGNRFFIAKDRFCFMI